MNSSVGVWLLLAVLLVSPTPSKGKRGCIWTIQWIVSWSLCSPTTSIFPLLCYSLTLFVLLICRWTWLLCFTEKWWRGTLHIRWKDWSFTWVFFIRVHIFFHIIPIALIAASEDPSQCITPCPICGDSPQVVICDGTMLGFRKDLLESFSISGQCCHVPFSIGLLIEVTFSPYLQVKLYNILPYVGASMVIECSWKPGEAELFFSNTLATLLTESAWKIHQISHLQSSVS